MKFETFFEIGFEKATKSGWLDKQTSKLIRTWQAKYCVLKNKVFLYYNLKNFKQPAACFNFDQVQITVEAKDSKIFYLEPRGCGRHFVFKAETEQECGEWIDLIRREVSSSLAEIYQIRNLASIKKFWLFPQISVYEFINQCRTGDILLFRSKNFISKAQRVLTMSSYDHVAVLVNHMGHVGFLEATRVTGVNLLFWTEFCERKWHCLYSRLIYRKLKASNHDFIDQSIKNFVTTTQGCKFNASFSKLLSHPDPDLNKGFFCSELVALAYQCSGLLPSDIKPSECWPGTFADERALYLINSSLGPLTQINFEI